LRFVVVCLVAAVPTVACMPSRGVRIEHSQVSSDRRPSGNSLVEIDPRTGSVVHVVQIADPGVVTVSGPSVWVASPRRRAVSRVDARSAKVITTTRLAATPVALAAGASGSVWVLVSGASPAAVRLDAKSGRIVKRFALTPCCPGPTTIASAPGGRVLWIGGRNGVLRIDPSTGVQSIVAPHLHAAAIAPAPGGRAFVSNGWLTVTPLPAGGQPSIAFREFGEGSPPAIDLAGLVYADGTLWVVASAKRLVVAISPYAINNGYANTSTGIRVGHTPADIAYGAGSLWVDSHGDGTVSQIDPTSQRVIRTIHLGYRPAGLATGAGAVWATARRVLATATATGLLAFDDHGQVYTSRPDGSDRRRLTHSQWPLQDIEPAWSPDGRQITFLRVRGDKENDAYAYTPLSLWVMNADGSRQRSIPHTSDALGSAPAWSPDGTKIAFDAGAQSGINTIEIDGRHRARIAGVLPNGGDPAWSPDGTRIGFDSNFHARDPNDFSLYTIRLDGTHLRRVTNVPSSYMQWSPDGHRIVYNRYRSDGAYLGEFITTASGGPGLRLLPPTNRYAGTLGASVVSWSPDGAAIAVSGIVAQFSTHPGIYVANSDGTGLTLVASGNDAAWRPVP
jgi:hypothetical protein